MDGRRRRFLTVSTLNLIWLGMGSAVVLAASVWAVAYRIGFNEGRGTIPLRLIAAMAEHKAGCERENPEDVVRELVAALKLSHSETQRLVAQHVRSARTIDHHKDRADSS